MKKKVGKILLCICICLLTSCKSNTDNSIICSTITKDEAVQIDIQYNYNNKGEIIEIIKMVDVTFSEIQLKEKTLQEYYNELEDVNVKGVTYVKEMDPKNNAIVSITSIDLTMYDFKEDAFEIGMKEDYQDITELIKEITSLGYYSCK